MMTGKSNTPLPYQWFLWHERKVWYASCIQTAHKSNHLKKTRKNRVQDFRAQATFHCATKNSKNTDDGNKTFCAGDMSANYSSMLACRT